MSAYTCVFKDSNESNVFSPTFKYGLCINCESSLKNGELNLKKKIKFQEKLF